MSVYDFKVKGAKGEEVDLSEYKGKVLLIVNTATGCGFTPQYEGLEKLYEEYKDRGFEVLDFPCNQFGNQAPGTNEEIVSFCQLKYNTTFRTFGKIEVNGENAAPLFRYLKEQKGFEGFPAGHPLSAVMEQVVSSIDPRFAENSEIKWNFTKFLVDRQGAVVARFEPTADMADVAAAVAKAV